MATSGARRRPAEPGAHRGGCRLPSTKGRQQLLDPKRQVFTRSLPVHPVIVDQVFDQFIDQNPAEFERRLDTSSDVTVPKVNNRTASNSF